MANPIMIRLGITCVFLIPGARGYLLIDAGTRGKAPVFRHALLRHGISPRQIRLIIVTHVHYDHVGSLQAIRCQCHCPVLVHHAEAEHLAQGRMALPSGTRPLTRGLIALAKRHPRLAQKLLRFDAVGPDRVIEGTLDLTPEGFDARIMPTPGHTPGSLSVVTLSGQAFVGDLAINYLPGGRGPFTPPFGESLDQIRESWRVLVDMDVTMIYPAHGRPFEAHKLPLG
jgi:glyoxylase-like metal-dependent hydrolase (beta-lactamase superfamily II)